MAIRFLDEQAAPTIRFLDEPTAPPVQQEVLQQPSTLTDRIANRMLSIAEPAAAIVSGAIAEPVAGIAGIAQALSRFSEPGAGARAVEATREALTFQPRTQAGQESLQAIGEVLAPVGEAISGAEKFLGDKVFQATNSPFLASVAATLPTAILETIGLKGAGRISKATKEIAPSKNAIKKSLTEAAPLPEKLKDISRGIYKELDESGVQIKPEIFDNFITRVEKIADKEGLSNLTTPRAFGVLEKIKSDAGKPLPVSRIQEQIRIAKKIGSLPDAAEASAANAIAGALVDELNDLSPAKVIKGNISATEIGKKLKAANNLWSRGSKGELLQEAIEKARNTASGFENGLRIEFSKITKSKKLKKFFKTSEIAAMNDLVRGDRAQNFAKLIGRFGFSEGRATNMLLSTLGSGTGAILGGIGGAFVVPAIGQASRIVAQKLTTRKADFINAVTRAGNDGTKITKAYLRTVPKNKRSVKDLSDLLSDPNVDITNLVTSSNKLIKEASEIAAGRQAIGQAIGTAAVGTEQAQRQQ